MQKLKNDIKGRILQVAETLFLQKGFLKTSMREIAETANIGVGNIYHYFPGKNEIFRTIVRPVTDAIENMLQSHHGARGEDLMQLCSESYLRKVVDEYLSLIKNNRQLMILLLFRAQGSSLEYFREQFTDQSTEVVKAWFADMKLKYPAAHIAVSDFFIHLHAVWMFTLFEEIIMHQIKSPEIEQIISEYIRFEITGWRNIISI